MARITVGAFLANATASAPLLVACGIATGNTLEALVGAWLLHRVVGFSNSLERLKDVLGLIIFAAGFSTTISATIGATSLCLGGIHPWEMYTTLWWIWWLGDAMGALVVAPALLTWATKPKLRWERRCILEAGRAAFRSGDCRHGGIYRAHFGISPDFALKYAVFPFIIWGALRFGQQGSATVVLVVLSLAIVGAWSSQDR